MLIPTTVWTPPNQLDVENNCAINRPDTVIDITDENLIQLADGILNHSQFVENNKIFIQNNSEISVNNRRSSAEDTDSFFAILNRLGDLLRNPPAQINLPSAPFPSAENSSTLEAINNPVTFTPYFQFDVINELDPHNNATAGPVESVDLIEFPLIKSNSHGQVGDKLQNPIVSQQIRLHCQGGTDETAPKLQKKTTTTIKLLTAIIKRGPVTTDIATIREAINSATKNRFDRLSHFPFPFPVFRTLQQLISLTNASSLSQTTANESIVLLSAFATNAINELIAIIKFISATGEFLKRAKIYFRELERKGFVWNRKPQGIHKPLRHLITILSCHHYSSIPIFLTRFNLITNSIDSNAFSILRPQLSVKFLRLLVLIILHQEYIQQPTRDLVLYKAFLIQEELNENWETKAAFQAKYTDVITNEGDLLIIRPRATTDQLNNVQIGVKALIEEFSNLKGQIGLQRQSPLTFVNRRNIAVDSIQNIITETRQTEKWPTTNMETPSGLLCTEVQQGNSPPETETEDETRKEITTLTMTNGDKENLHIADEVLTPRPLIPTPIPSTLNISQLVNQLMETNPSAIIILLP